MTLSIRTCTITLTLIATIAIPRSLLGQSQPAFEEGHHHHHYKLIDLGTFGGPASYFPNGLDGFFNDHGIAAGWANTSTPDPYPAFCFTPSCFVSHAFRWRDGSLKTWAHSPEGAAVKPSGPVRMA